MTLDARRGQAAAARGRASATPVTVESGTESQHTHSKEGGRRHPSVQGVDSERAQQMACRANVRAPRTARCIDRGADEGSAQSPPRTLGALTPPYRRLYPCPRRRVRRRSLGQLDWAAWGRGAGLARWRCCCSCWRHLATY
eukprot:362548-Chlamydomonas_euryale.AAC.10